MEHGKRKPKKISKKDMDVFVKEVSEIKKNEVLALLQKKRVTEGFATTSELKIIDHRFGAGIKSLRNMGYKIDTVRAVLEGKKTHLYYLRGFDPNYKYIPPKQKFLDLMKDVYGVDVVEVIEACLKASGTIVKGK